MVHTVPFTCGTALFGTGVVQQMVAQGFFFRIWLALCDTRRFDRMMMDLDSRFYRGSVSELDDRIMEGSKT